MIHHAHGRRGSVAGQLAADQVQGLDAGGAFVNRRDALIAVVLPGAGLLNETHAAMNLQRKGDVFQPRLAAVAFNNRGQHLHPIGGFQALGLPGRAAADIQHRRIK